MKRIKTFILSGAALMATLMVGNVSRANGIQTLVMNGGGLESYEVNEETGIASGVLKCPIINLGGGEQGSSTLTFESQIVGDVETIIQANYTYERNGESVTGTDIEVVDFASFKKSPTDTKYLVSCKCEGTVSGTWNGATVTQMSCNCLLEVDEIAGTMTCKACICQLS